MASKKKQITIACQGAHALDLDEFTELQGELKSLSTDNYAKLRDEILTDGFSFTPHVWHNGGKNYIVDGHQRLRTVRQMVEKEGYFCPPIPVSYVMAENLNHAKRKVLAAASQYGVIERQGLYEFMTGAEITLAEVDTSFRLPEIDMEVYREEYTTVSEHERRLGETSMPTLPSGARDPYQQMTFSLHDSQAEDVKRALIHAMEKPVVDPSGNDNRNGNALAAVCRRYLGAHGVIG